MSLKTSKTGKNCYISYFYSTWIVFSLKIEKNHWKIQKVITCCPKILLWKNWMLSAPKIVVQLSPPWKNRTTIQHFDGLLIFHGRRFWRNEHTISEAFLYKAFWHRAKPPKGVLTHNVLTKGDFTVRSYHHYNCCYNYYRDEGKAKWRNNGEV